MTPPSVADPPMEPRQSREGESFPVALAQAPARGDLGADDSPSALEGEIALLGLLSGPGSIPRWHPEKLPQTSTGVICRSDRVPASVSVPSAY